MRCQPGDFAIVDTPADGGRCKCYVGKPVVLREYMTDELGQAYWILSDPWRACVHYCHINPWLYKIPDRMLRPIRP